MRKIIFALAAFALAFGLAACGNTAEKKAENASVPEQAAAERTDLVIPVNEITETAKFYSVTVDGRKMEVFAVRDSSGKIRTAFNTCQSCYTSGNGRYELEGTDLVCQNCGFHFTADQVGAKANGGCSPWAISAEDREESEDTIRISYDYLSASKKIFANWK